MDIDNDEDDGGGGGGAALVPAAATAELVLAVELVGTWAGGRDPLSTRARLAGGAVVAIKRSAAAGKEVELSATSVRFYIFYYYSQDYSLVYLALLSII